MVVVLVDAGAAVLMKTRSFHVTNHIFCGFLVVLSGMMQYIDRICQ